MSARRLIPAAVVVVLLATMTSGCIYATARAIDEETVVITKYNAYLFGALRSAQVCKVAEPELTLTECSRREMR